MSDNATTTTEFMQNKEKQVFEIDYPLAHLLGAERAIIKQCYDEVPFADESIVQALHALMDADGSEKYCRKLRSAFFALAKLRQIVLREGSPNEHAQIAVGSDAMLELQDAIDDLAIEQGLHGVM